MKEEEFLENKEKVEKVCDIELHGEQFAQGGIIVSGRYKYWCIRTERD